MVRPIQLMIAGVEKSGTSSLARYLAKHPSICTHKQREMNFFVRDKAYELGYERIFSRYFGTCQDETKVIMAKSAGTMYWPEAVRRLQNHNPDVQLVVVLRNPVDRAYSGYWYTRRMGWEDLKSFEEAIAAEPSRLKEDGMKRRHCTYLDRGMYYKQLIVLLEHFGRDQLHVFLFEDLKNDPVGVCQTIFGFIGVNPSFVPDIGKQYNKAAIPRFVVLSKLLSSRSSIKQTVRGLIPYEMSYRIRKTFRRLNQKEFSPPPMNPQTRERLVEYFKPFNKDLGDLIGRNLGHWNK